jgi:hypothetical protein
MILKFPVSSVNSCRIFEITGVYINVLNASKCAVTYRHLGLIVFTYRECSFENCKFVMSCIFSVVYSRDAA